MRYDRVHFQNFARHLFRRIRTILNLRRPSESKPLTDLPQKNVPSIYQFARNDEEKQLFRLGLVKPNSYARPYALPPGVPADRVRALEAALQKTLRDPELLAEADKSRLSLGPISGAQLRGMISDGLSMPAKLKEKLRPMLAPGN